MTWPPVYDPTYRPPPEEPYWLRREETMPAEERKGLILAKLKAQVAYAWERSPFYRRKWQAAGFHPEQLKTLEDIRRIPILTKDDLRKEQEENPPFGAYLCADPTSLVRVHGTSGTTGRPTVFAIDGGDWQRIAHAHARIMWGFGVRPGDTVFIGSIFSLYIGSWGALVGAERLGATAFPFGAGVPGQTERAVEWIALLKPTVFYGTPSYALYLAEVAQRMGYDPRRDFRFRILFFSGEPGAGVPETKRRIEETYGGICVDTGSMAEMTPWMTNAECQHRTGMHLWNDIVYTEIVDPKTREPVPPGGEGVPVYTHLERTSQPMIRYWSGDLTRWTDEPCPCGRTYPRLPRGIYGRVDDMFIVRGVNVYPAAVENVLRGFAELGEEYRIIITRKTAMDKLSVQVEAREAIQEGSDALKALQGRVEAALKRSIGVTARVAIVAPGTLPRTEFKARRVVDQRKLYEEITRG
jgi:phenylacetate-CoA ligase